MKKIKTKIALLVFMVSFSLSGFSQQISKSNPATDAVNKSIVLKKSPKPLIPIQTDVITNGIHHITTYQNKSNSPSSTLTPLPETVLLDTRNQPAANATGSTPRTFMGEGFTNNNLPAGAIAFKITSVTMYLLSATDATYNDLTANIKFWNSFNGANTPVFSNDLGSLSSNFGTQTLAANSFYELDLTLSTPIILTGGSGTSWGWAQNFKGNGADNTNLTSLITSNPNGTYPVGQILSGAAPGRGYFRNVTGRTDFNFNSSDLRSIGLIAQGVGIIIRGNPVFPTFTVSYDANGGTGTLTDPNSPYTSGATATVLSPAGSISRAGYTFTGWNTAANGSGTSYAVGGDLSMTSNTTLFAQWTPTIYTLTYTAGAGGSISGTSPQSVNSGANGSAVTAVPSSGCFAFVDWSDGSTANPRTDNNVQNDLTVTANFVPVPVPATPGTFTSGQKYNLCSGGTFTYTIDPVAGATSYTWTVPPSFTNVIDNQSTSISVTIPPGIVNEKMTVTANNTCGSSAIKTLNLWGRPDTFSIAGPICIPIKAKALTYSIVSPVTGLVYNWVVSGKTTIVSGQGTPTVTVNWGGASGNISAIASNSCGTLKKSLFVNAGCTATAASTPLSRQLKTYPNPTKGLTTLAFTSLKETKYSIFVFDMEGKLLITKEMLALVGNNKVTLDLSNYAKGLFTIRLVSDEGSSNLKVIKSE